MIHERAADADAPRPADLRLARLHLRIGALSLARAELEALAGAGELDDAALLDLAEVRWRTGDTAGAGDAAVAAMAAGEESVLALVVAAEARAAAGRPAEARRLAEQAIDRAGGSLDAVFAGMPRSAIWPHDPSARAVPVGTLFVEPGRPAPPPLSWIAPAAPTASIPAGTPSPAVTTPARLIASGPKSAPPAPPGLWDSETASGARGGPEPGSAAALDAARADLAAGRAARAADRLAILLRFAPAHAPAVIALLEGAHGAPVELVRGDAYRLVGHELAARHAFEAAAVALAGETGERGDTAER